MSSPKLLAYKAIIDHAAMLQDILKNPHAIELAFDEYAAGFALAESKKIEAEKAFQAIEDAKRHKEEMEKRQSEFDEQVSTALEALKQRRAEVDSLQSKYNETKTAADIILEESKKLKKAAEDLTVQANNKFADIESREKAHQKNLDYFAVKQERFEAEKTQHKINAANLIARENKLKEALS